MLNLNKPFVFENREYWDYMPHSRGNSVRTSHLRIINGVLYQWLQGMSRDAGFWLKVPTIHINDDQKEHVGLDLNVGDKVIFESWVGSGCEKFPITVTDITYKENGLYFGWRNDVVNTEDVITNCRIDTRRDKFVKV